MDFYGSMGQAVAERTILRKKEEGEWETWDDVANRVSLGNGMLDPRPDKVGGEIEVLRRHMKKANILLSGRQLQHGDEKQSESTQEKFTNCSTAMTSFLSFYLLLNGSGVGRSYDRDLLVTDWSEAPTLITTLSNAHPDFDYDSHLDLREAIHIFNDGKTPEFDKWVKRGGKNVYWHKVEDSREGWACAFGLFEYFAWKGCHRDDILILDFSDVRCKGSPIRGIQNRPASGPAPTMLAFERSYRVVRSGMPNWKKTMYIDHYLASCVQVGGVRRSARIAFMHWRDPDVLDFINVKRPIEFLGKDVSEVRDMIRAGNTPSSFLWSANNSVGVDNDFYRLISLDPDDPEYDGDDARWARKVADEIVNCNYGDGTGEPGLVNLEALVSNSAGIEEMLQENTRIIGSDHFDMRAFDDLIRDCVKTSQGYRYSMITNPCVTGETMILTTDGEKPVSELVGTPFYALVEGQPYYSRGFFRSGVKKTVVVKTIDGRSVELTPDHLVMTLENNRRVWLEASNLREGDAVLIARDDGVTVVTMVSSVEEGEQKPVYDCRVDEVHAFFGNGYMLHNCGEISLHVMGGFCVIADVVPFHSDTLDEAEDAFRTAARALIRVNLMPSVYEAEVKRTNRIGVGFTGIFEFAWKFFRVGFEDLIDPDEDSWKREIDSGKDWKQLAEEFASSESSRKRSMAFWITMNRFGRAAIEEAYRYSDELGINHPHTVLTVKPAGTTSKLFGLTEGAHLPSMKFYLRWVQFSSSDPLVEKYRKMGYPVRELKTYSGSTIVGFPTAKVISTLGMGDKLKTADDVPFRDNFTWVSLIEKYYLRGVDPITLDPLEDVGNQVSYTAKYDPDSISLEEFRESFLGGMKRVKACSVMPIINDVAYEYVPEEEISEDEYYDLIRRIENNGSVKEDVSFEHVSCEGGSCPIDFREDTA